MILLRLHVALALLSLQVRDHLADGLHRLRHEEDGLTTTELAVVTFLLVGAAIVVMGIIFTAAQNNANNIPVPEAPAP